MQRDSPDQTAKLYKDLYASLKLKKEGRGKKTTNTVHNTKYEVQSWKFNEWDYPKSVNGELLPINARGLFTFEDREIVVRGYDKFFNVGEVPLTTESNLLENTEGPYEITLKENGCIILIGGLPSGEIVVCSKHSTGEREGLSANHALEGESHLVEQLKPLNKSLAQLGAYLYENNLTAVAELCDDEFEEHVLPYGKDNSGLYLHGLNYNTIKFKTLPMAEVYKFADDWGFKTIDSFTYNNPVKLFEFFEESKKTGKYKGKEVEGFVIRCKLKNGDDLFFKYKFEQPYLLYRQFREATKQYLRTGAVNQVKIKKNKYITGQYLEFVAQLFAKNPQLKEDFVLGHGIINARTLFLESIGETDGMNLLNIDRISEYLERLSLGEKSKAVNKYIFIPIATISCGKTTTFQTLTNLFPDWKHIQNDNIGRGSKLKLSDQCLRELYSSDVVLLDRNNSEYKLRKQLFSDFEAKRNFYLGDDPDIQLHYIGLNFVSDKLFEDQKALWDITLERTKARGDNHQSIKYESDSKTAIFVMKKFMNSFQKVNPAIEPDSKFDLIIDLNIEGENSSLTNVKFILENLYKTYPDLIAKKPTADELSKAFASALEYVPTYTKKMSAVKKVQPTFIGVDIDPKKVHSRLDKFVGSESEWQKLKCSGRVQKEFHVTLGHSASARKLLKPKWKVLQDILMNGAEIATGISEDVVKSENNDKDSQSKGNKGKTNKAKELASKGNKTVNGVTDKPEEIRVQAVNADESKSPGKLFLDFYADVKLQRVVVHEEKLICMEVEIVEVYNTTGKKVSIEPLNKHLHVTVGTSSKDIKAAASNDTLEKLNSVSGVKSGQVLIEEEIMTVVEVPGEIIRKQRIFAQF